MKRFNAIYVYLILITLYSPRLFCQLKSDHFLPPVSFPLSYNKQDSMGHRDNIKIDPLKIFLNEISVSYEHFKSSPWIKTSVSDITDIDSIINKQKAERVSSMNYIFGFYFASDFVNAVHYKQDVNYACIERFDDIGISPYINWGASVKLEYRRYRNSFYYGPQIMEKFVFYNKQYIDDQSGAELEGLIRLQSGYANIIGIGYSAGWQIAYNRFVTDFYMNVSGRMRLAAKKIYEEQNDMGPNVIFPEPKIEHLNRFYPFLCLGIRLGFSI